MTPLQPLTPVTPTINISLIMPPTTSPPASTAPTTYTTTAITPLATTIPIADTNALPHGPNLATLCNNVTSETVSYEAISGDTLTGVARGQTGTRNRSWDAGTVVSPGICSACGCPPSGVLNIPLTPVQSKPDVPIVGGHVQAYYVNLPGSPVVGLAVPGD